jgi:hypothetical protein
MTSNYSFKVFAVLCFCLFVSGCSDPDIVKTDLTNGFYHSSNGGHLGVIYSENSDFWYPGGADFGPFCDELCVIDQFILGKEVIYAKRAFVDPPISTVFFVLDTRNRRSKTFESRERLVDYCKTIGIEIVPEFVPPEKLRDVSVSAR